MNTLYYGYNLDNLRKLKDETVDLCYIDPPIKRIGRFQNRQRGSIRLDRISSRSVTSE